MAAPSFTPSDLARLEQGGTWRVGELMLGLYRVEAVRSGGMGAVYLCRGGTPDGVAIKTVTADRFAGEAAQAEMRRAAERWKGLGLHRHVIPCSDVLVSPHDGRLLLVLERVQPWSEHGPSLGDVLEETSLDEEMAVAIAVAVARGMRFVEESGLVHRDLKPDNVLLSARATKVSDVGLARTLPGGTSAGSAVGTPAYLAPEGWRGELSVSSDIYAFGVILWEMLADEHPFAAHLDDPAAARHAHCTAPLPDLRRLSPHAPAHLLDLALACLAKDPSQRPAGFAEVLDALQRPGSPRRRAEDPIRRVHALMDQGRWAEAEQQLQELSPEDPALDVLRLRLFEETGRVDEGWDVVRRVAAIAAGDGAGLRFRQRALALLGRHQEALAVVEAALRAEPEAGDLHHVRGILLWKLQRPDEALAAFAAARRLPASIDRARLLVALGREGDAFLELAEHLWDTTLDEGALLAIALECDELGHVPEALKAADAMLRLDPSSREARRIKARVKKHLHRQDEAAAELRELLRDDPENVELWSDLLAMLPSPAQDGEIEECARHMAEGRAQTGRGFLLKGTMLAGFGDHAAALPWYWRALFADPTRFVTWDLLGEAFGALGQTERAIHAYRQALLLSPANKAVQARLAEVEARLAPGPSEPSVDQAWTWHQEAVRCLKARDFARAEVYYRRAAQADPRDPRHTAGLAASLAQLPGRLTEALALFEETDRRLPNDPTLLFNWTGALIKAKQHAKASDLARRLRALTPDDPDLVDLLAPLGNLDEVERAPAVWGQGREYGGISLRADGVLVNPEQHLFVVAEHAGGRPPDRVLQEGLNAMDALVNDLAGGKERELPCGYDQAVPYEANMLRNVLRLGQEALRRGGTRAVDLAAAFTARDGTGVEVAFSGNGRCLLVRGDAVYRLGEPAAADFVVRGYNLEPGDRLVLSSRATVEGRTGAACAPPATPRQAAETLAREAGACVIVWTAARPE